MTVFSWKGRHGTCVVGPTYAQGDRRDLGEMILALSETIDDEFGAAFGKRDLQKVVADHANGMTSRHEPWCRLRNPGNTAECDCGVPLRNALDEGSGA